MRKLEMAEIPKHTSCAHLVQPNLGQMLLNWIVTNLEVRQWSPNILSKRSYFKSPLNAKLSDKQSCGHIMKFMNTMYIIFWYKNIKSKPWPEKDCRSGCIGYRDWLVLPIHTNHSFKCSKWDSVHQIFIHYV